MRGYNDPTANKAIGEVLYEWRKMADLALRIRSPRVNPVWADQASKLFTGIYKRLLTDDIEEVRKIVE